MVNVLERSRPKYPDLTAKIHDFLIRATDTVQDFLVDAPLGIQLPAIKGALGLDSRPYMDQQDGRSIGKAG